MNVLDYFLSDYKYVVCITLALMGLGHHSVQTLRVAFVRPLGRYCVFSACIAQNRDAHTDHCTTLLSRYENSADGMVISWTALTQQLVIISVFPLCQLNDTSVGCNILVFHFLFTSLALSSRRMWLWAWFAKGSATWTSRLHTCTTYSKHLCQASQSLFLRKLIFVHFWVSSQAAFSADSLVVIWLTIELDSMNNLLRLFFVTMAVV